MKRALFALLTLFAFSAAVADGVEVTVKTPLSYTLESATDSGYKRVCVTDAGAFIQFYNQAFVDLITVQRDPTLLYPEIRVCNKTTYTITVTFYNCPAGQGCSCSVNQRLSEVEVTLEPGTCATNGTVNCVDIF